MFETNDSNTFYVAVDHGSGGIVSVHTNQFIIDNLTSCFMDVNYNIYYPWDLINIDENLIIELKQNNKDFRLSTKKTPVEYKGTTVSFDRFKEIKNLCMTRLPYHEYLYSMSKYYYNRYSFGFTQQHDQDADYILQSDELIKSYAKALDTSPNMAMQELKLQNDMIKATRANIFIAYSYYVNKINHLTTREELDPIMQEIQVGFKFGHNYE
jgi:penicillin-binding protein-related factor A (putative recombinase)